MKSSKRLLALAIATACGTPMVAFATNGMNLEGYGPVATGMGGASMAYDNGTAAMANNPATLGLAEDGSRLDVSVGVLAPHVKSENTNGSESSASDSFMMPAIGWAKKNGQLSFGVGMFAQGGMGAEYGAGSAVDQSGPDAFTNGGVFCVPAMAAIGACQPDLSGHKQKSELGVGRLIFPVAYNVNDKLSVGGSIDYVWGGLDILWSMDANNFFGGLDKNKYGAAMAPYGVSPDNNRSRISGSMVNTFLGGFISPANMGAGTPNNGDMVGFYWGNFDFNDGSSFTQATKGAGFAGKLGFTYKVNNQLTIGGTYHAKTAMSDFEGDIDLSWNVDVYSYGADNTLGTADDQVMNMTIPVTGKVKVVDFQWPTTYGLGLSYQATDKLMVAADWKRLAWSDVMQDFHMVITADKTAANGPMAGKVLDFVYFQNWKDQDVINLGVGYRYTDAVTLRAGYNYASNPVPNDTVSFLFPATIERHYTVGVGYAIDKASSVDFSMTYAPEVKVKETSTEDANLGGASSASPATTITHSQTNWQLMYSYRF